MKHVKDVGKLVVTENLKIYKIPRGVKATFTSDSNGLIIMFF